MKEKGEKARQAVYKYVLACVLMEEQIARFAHAALEAVSSTITVPHLRMRCQSTRTELAEKLLMISGKARLAEEEVAAQAAVVAAATTKANIADAVAAAFE